MARVLPWLRLEGVNAVCWRVVAGRPSTMERSRTVGLIGVVGRSLACERKLLVSMFTAEFSGDGVRIGLSAYCDIEVIAVLDEVEPITLQLEHLIVILTADR